MSKQKCQSWGMLAWYPMCHVLLEVWARRTGNIPMIDRSKMSHSENGGTCRWFGVFHVNNFFNDDRTCIAAWGLWEGAWWLWEYLVLFVLLGMLSMLSNPVLMHLLGQNEKCMIGE